MKISSRFPVRSNHLPTSASLSPYRLDHGPSASIHHWIGSIYIGGLLTQNCPRSVLRAHGHDQESRSVPHRLKWSRKFHEISPSGHSPVLVHLGHSCPVCGAEAICPPYRLYGVRGKSGCETEWSRLVKGLDQLVAPSLLLFSLVRRLNVREEVVEDEEDEEAFMVGNKTS